MNTLKRFVSTLLSILLVCSVITVTGITTFASDDVTVTVKSAQNLFEDVCKTYKRNDTFEFTFLWQNTYLLRAAKFDTLFDINGLRVIGDEMNPILTSTSSNISDELQESESLVTANFSTNNGVDFSTQSFLIKYKFIVSESASAEETIVFDIEDIYGNPVDDVTNYIDFIYDNQIIEENADKFSGTVVLGDGVPAETTPGDSSNPTESDSSTPNDSSKPNESDSSTPSDPSNPNGSGSSSSGTSSEPNESDSTNPSDSGSSEPSDPTTPSDTTATEPSEPTTAPATKAPVLNITKTKLKAGKTTTASVSNKNGQKVTYTSSKKNVVKIDKNTGKITALNKGTSTITAKIGNKKLTKKVQVTSAPTVKQGKKTLKNNKKITVNKGKTVKLTITGKASKINNKVTFKNKKLVKVTSKKTQAKVTFKALKKGNTTLTIKINGSKSYKYKIRVK